jgi:cytochrome subunit of sulfide dehydrogenase
VLCHYRIDPLAELEYMRTLYLCRLLLAGILLEMYPAWSLAHDPVHFCMDCHGLHGVSTEPDLPSIGGLPHAYLVNSLSAYWEGTRPCPDYKFRAGDTGREKTNMCVIAKALNTRDVELVASYFSSQRFVPARQKTDPARVMAGKKLHEQHCQSCHANGGRSARDDAGILAGQWMDYLRVTFQDFKGGARVMPAQMEAKIELLNAEDVEALVHYYGSQQ